MKLRQTGQSEAVRRVEAHRSTSPISRNVPYRSDQDRSRWHRAWHRQRRSVLEICIHPQIPRRTAREERMRRLKGAGRRDFYPKIPSLVIVFFRPNTPRAGGNETKQQPARCSLRSITDARGVKRFPTVVKPRKTVGMSLFILR